MILKNIYKRKGRAIMVVVALATATALLLSMLSISEAMRRSAKNEIEQSRVDVQLSAGGFSYYTGIELGVAGIKNARGLCHKLSNLSEVKLATPVLRETSGEIMVIGKRKTTPVYSHGIIPNEAFTLLSEREKKRYPKYGYGGFLKSDDAFYTKEWAEEVLVDKNLAEDLDIMNGTQIKLSTLNTQHNFTVVGIFDPEVTGGGAFKGIYFVVLHLYDLQRLLGKEKEDVVTMIQLSLTPETRGSKRKVEEFKTHLEELYPFLTVETKEDLLKKAQEQVAISRAYYSMMGLIALVIGLLFVMCVMVMNVHERTQEIGVLRAIGVSRKTIFGMIFVEALILVLLGSAVGIVPGYFGSIMLGEYFSESLGVATEFTAFTPELILSSLAQIIIFGCLFSLYPAWKSTRIKVIDAMRRK